jgi:hypothetical protein
MASREVALEQNYEFKKALILLQISITDNCFTLLILLLLHSIGLLNNL